VSRRRANRGGKGSKRDGWRDANGEDSTEGASRGRKVVRKKGSGEGQGEKLESECVWEGGVEVRGGSGENGG